jgi:predicted lipid carrier protein YhbT
MNRTDPLNRPFGERLPPLLRHATQQLRWIVQRLPVQPPSFVAARMLDLVLWPKLDASAREALSGRIVEVELVETGVRVRLRLSARGFAVAPASGVPAVCIRARTDALWRLARAIDDADRLFFDRALVIEGDTEFGLILKNTLDAIGPLWGPRQS